MNRTIRMGLICGGALLGGAALLAAAGQARAQSPFTKVVAFGDSWADTGNFFRLLGLPNLPQYPTGRFSGGTNYVDTTAQLLGIPLVSHAIGGATTGSINLALPGIPGFAQQWQDFVAGQRIAPTDLVTLNIGGNDVRVFYQGGGTLAGVPAAAATSASQALAGVNALVGAGARTFVVTTGDTGAAPASAGTPLAAIGTAYSRDYNGLMQAGLAAVARTGVRVELIDTAMIVRQIKASPALYGIANVGVCPVACVGDPALQNQYLYYFDGVHPTSRGFAIFAAYIVNRLNAPFTFAPQGDLALSTAMGFAATLFGRLDLFREAPVLAPAPRSAGGPPAPVAFGRAPLASPWSFYMQANGAIGERSRSATSAGYQLDSVGGTLGLEYRINANAFVGAAFDYANPKARLRDGAGTLDAHSYQFGLYGAWADANFFAQGLATVGRQDSRNTRPGVVDTLASRPDGTTAVAAGKLGYLFDIGPVQAGPIGGLTYAWARVNGYSEVGDPVLTLKVGPQVAQALVGSLGGQLRATVRYDDRIITPYLNLTVEHDLLGNGRIIAYQANSAPLIVNAWTVPGAPRSIYGRVAGGFSAAINANVALSATLSRSVGRRGGDDFHGSGAIRISF